MPWWWFRRWWSGQKSGNTHVRCQVSIMVGGKNMFAAAQIWNHRRGQIQSWWWTNTKSGCAQIRYRDWDKSDIKGFRQLSRGCWLRRLWDCQQPQRRRLLILMRMGTRVRKRNPLWEWSMLDLWSDPLWKCRSRKVKVEIVKTSEECHTDEIKSHLWFEWLTM